MTMSDAIWKFAEEEIKEKSPYEILIKYANKLQTDTNNLIVGKVTEVISQESQEIVYALYLMVPKLRNYSYRLIEVIQPNALRFYPVRMKLFGAAPENIIEEKNVTEPEFEAKLIGFINNPLTKSILKHIQTLVEIRDKYQK